MRGRRNLFFLTGWLWLLLLGLLLSGKTAEAVSLKEPVLKNAKAVGSAVAVSWKPVAKATEYWVFRKGGERKNFTKIAEHKDLRKLLFRDETVDPGISYTYTVQAVARSGRHIYKSSKSNKGVEAVAAIPTVVLDKCTAGEDSARITWQSAGNVTAYQVLRKKKNASFHRLATVKGTTLGYTDTSVTTGAEYVYTVRAVVTDGKTNRVGSYDAKGLSVQIPGPSLTLTRVDVQDGAVALVWKNVKNVKGYIIYRKNSDSRKWRKIGKIYGSDRNCWYDDTGKPGEIYNYAVCTFINVGNQRVTGPLAENGEDIIWRPASAVLTSVTKEDGYDVLTWNKVPDIAGYEIYRKTGGDTGSWSLARRISSAVSSAKLLRLTEDETISYAIRAYAESEQGQVTSSRMAAMTNEVLPGAGEKILFVGDSIVWGSVGNRVKASTTFVQRVSQVTGASCYSSGVIGSLITRQTASDRSVASRFESNSIHVERYTTICIAAGTNDYGRNIRRGTITDKTDKTFYGALNRIFREIKKRNPKAKVVLITPIYRCRFGNDWSMRGYSQKNKAGFTLNNYASAMKKMAAKRGAYLYDSSRQGVITEKNALTMLADGLHPCQNGHLDIGESIGEFLNENVFQ